MSDLSIGLVIAACSRMRSDWDRTSKIIKEDGSYKHKWIEDLCTITDAYLAEHPADDDEPVTEEWLDEMFGTYLRQFWEWSVIYGVRIAKDPDGFKLLTGYQVARTGLARGDVRRLCSALGIPLSESQ
jgi:hypothetical protein